MIQQYTDAIINEIRITFKIGKDKRVNCFALQEQEVPALNNCRNTYRIQAFITPGENNGMCEIVLSCLTGNLWYSVIV